MAEYTIRLSDYLTKYGYTLPVAFDDVPALNDVSFSELFTQYYSDWEIGFETPELFQTKLNVHAQIICPFYTAKIDAIQEKIDSGIFNSEMQKTIRNYVNPSDIQNLNNSTGSDAQTETLTGLHTSESMIDAIVKYQNDIRNLYFDLLKEFENLFMGLL